MKLFTPTSGSFIIDGDPTSDNAELPNIPSHGGVARVIITSGACYIKFGDDMVEASATDGMYLGSGGADAEYVVIPAGATHLACFNGNLNVTVGYLS